MKPIIALNFKTYRESLGKKGIELSQIAAEVALLTGVRIVVAPQTVDLRQIADIYDDVFAQHADHNPAGAYTGSITLEGLKDAKVKGTLLNHSEKRVTEKQIEETIGLAKKEKIEVMLCTKDAEESARLAKYRPTYIAVEPPELIGSGISVSTAKPEVVTSTIEAVEKVAKIPVLCGAGISNSLDVKRAIELGACGVLLASAFVKSPDPKKLLLEMAEAIA
ncbi:MAG: triose-phosphate isomerase [Candidatus Micrarchaeota archaeon]|nr:triose-phosphate isomerase [Candidatus Micrarchaeota archaeon]